jgi:hypothetical protein
VDNTQKRKRVKLALRILTNRDTIDLSNDDLDLLGYYYAPDYLTIKERALDILTDTLVPDHLEVL